MRFDDDNNKTLINYYLINYVSRWHFIRTRNHVQPLRQFFLVIFMIRRQFFKLIPSKRASIGTPLGELRKQIASPSDRHRVAFENAFVRRSRRHLSPFHDIVHECISWLHENARVSVEFERILRSRKRVFFYVHSAPVVLLQNNNGGNRCKILVNAREFSKLCS